jgi:hypothetical protein
MPILIVITCLIALNAWMTRRVLRAPEEHLDKKWTLIAGIWIMPLIGAWIARNQLRAAVPGAARTAEERAWARALESREPAPERVSASGEPDLELQAHIIHSHGFPWLDWDAVADWTKSIQPELAEARECATDQCRRAWLLHLRDALGPDFLVHESEHALILSSLEPQVVRAIANYVEKTRQRVSKLLGSLANLPLHQKSILVVFDDEDSYYRYIGTLYPDGGEFALTGGMFIDAGCPHFVTRRAALAQIEPVIAHELTHSAVSHLDLPLWLDEGIAVNTEHKLTGVPHSLYTPQQMHAKHLEFWDETEIQQFWSGASFHRPDDGQLLSYDLARILVDNLAREWARFERFASQASRGDAGAQAAAQQLGVDLGACACALLGRQPSDGWTPRPAATMAELPARAAARRRPVP